MRQYIITLLLMLFTASASAQNTQKLNERYFQAKVRELTMRLDMSDSQKEKFVPIYRRYSEEMRATVGEYKKPAKPLTNEERLALTKRKMERQQQAQSIRMKYVDEFATILSADQVSRFFEVENEIQRKLMQRRQQASQQK
ncbi:MAG: Spy/CpxP family protein refolding chaperone [Bacteroidaceae bacterium]|nr:Spy/CpxP family protein refolding chaperone [Bacteroidaceae bacterium]